MIINYKIDEFRVAKFRRADEALPEYDELFSGVVRGLFADALLPDEHCLAEPVAHSGSRPFAALQPGYRLEWRPKAQSGAKCRFCGDESGHHADVLRKS